MLVGLLAVWTIADELFYTTRPTIKGTHNAFTTHIRQPTPTRASTSHRHRYQLPTTASNDMSDNATTNDEATKPQQQPPQLSSVGFIGSGMMATAIMDGLVEKQIVAT